MCRKRRSMSTPFQCYYQNSLRVLDRYLTFNDSTCAVSNLADFLGEGGVHEYIHVCLLIFGNTVLLFLYRLTCSKGYVQGDFPTCSVAEVISLFFGCHVLMSCIMSSPAVLSQFLVTDVCSQPPLFMNLLHSLSICALLPYRHVLTFLFYYPVTDACSNL